MKKIIIGVDEAGRGSLAGEVAVAAVALDKQINFFGKIKDSKKLSQSQREKWFALIKKELLFAVSFVSFKIIDQKGIKAAVNIGAERVIKKILKKIPNNSVVKVYLDFGIEIDEKNIGVKIYKKTFKKGDEKIRAISLASVVAKVKRDKLMVKHHLKYPCYKFNLHKGYGTNFHLSAIKKFGYLDIHRKSFKIKKLSYK